MNVRQLMIFDYDSLDVGFDSQNLVIKRGIKYETG